MIIMYVKIHMQKRNRNVIHVKNSCLWVKGLLLSNLLGFSKFFITITHYFYNEKNVFYLKDQRNAINDIPLKGQDL